MRPSPSALFNNLAQAAGCVVYAHKCSVSSWAMVLLSCVLYETMHSVNHLR